MIRPSGRPITAVLTTAVLLVAVAACRAGTPAPGESPEPAPHHRAAPPSRAETSTYTLLQMNLCLSGIADCYATTRYPKVVDEAVSRIQGSQPHAVTVNEACRADAVRIARRTAYHLRFVPVEYAGAPFPCVEPADRGLFGLAVLTKQPVVRSESAPFRAQVDLERRRWLCVSTRDGVDVCTAHLEAPYSAEAAATNDAQCGELGEVLRSRGPRATLFAGDVNRREPCAPEGSWSRTDAAVQHVYGTQAFGRPVVQVVPSEFSDHNLLVVSAPLSVAGAARAAD